MQVLKSRQSLRSHIHLVHIGARPFKCDECGQVICTTCYCVNLKKILLFTLSDNCMLFSHFQFFKTKYYVKHHIKYAHPTDENALKFKCPQCSRVSKNSTQQDIHIS